MEPGVVSPLSSWENFYVIVGSSAGALTGLQFVVIALVSDTQAASSMVEIRAFGTPTIVHFCAALLVSAILSAPWRALSGAGLSLAICGAAGVVYTVRIITHARQQTHYRPDAEDWAWYVAIPLVAYAALAGAAVLLASRATPVLFVIAAVTLLLLFVGIHNAWDSVTYVAIRRRQAPDENPSRRQDR